MIEAWARFRRRDATSMLAVFIAVSLMSEVFAETDTIWVEPPIASESSTFVPRRLLQRVGSIQTFDDQTLVFTTAGETTATSLPAPRVVWAEPSFAEPEINDALKRFREGDYAASIAPLLDAVTRRPPVWRAQWLSMHLWQAAFQAQRYPAVLELVNQIDARPLPTLILGGLPIRWSDDRLPPPALEAAQLALHDQGSLDATRLVAASWLMGHKEEPAAMADLQKLASNERRPELAALAQALLWRTLTPPAVLAAETTQSNLIRHLPLTISPGPAVLWACRLEAAGKKEAALEWFLQVSVTPARPHLDREFAKTRAATILESSGLADEAAKLRQDSLNTIPFTGSR